MYCLWSVNSGSSEAGSNFNRLNAISIQLPAQRLATRKSATVLVYLLVHIESAIIEKRKTARTVQSIRSFSDCRLDEIRYWTTKAAVYRANGGSLWDTYARLMTIAMCILITKGQLPYNCRTAHHLFEIFQFQQHLS